MKKKLILNGLQSCLPIYHLQQSHILNWVKSAHRRSEDIRPTSPMDFPLERYIERYAIKDSLIEQRYFECDDIFTNDWNLNEVYKITEENPMGSGIDQRNAFFQKRANKVLQQLFPEHIQAPSHLIHVSCTGYMAPSAAQVLVSQRQWQATEVTHAYHMGCYASLPAVRMAAGLQNYSEKSIDIVHTEMCSLHMNPAAHGPEQIVVQTLFADGHIKYRIGKEIPGEAGFELIAIKEKILPHSIQDMTWSPAPWGMQMSLSRDVPEKLKKVIRNFYLEMISEADLDQAEILKSAIFAIHPGGPKIIEVLKQELELSEEQIAASKKVLRERGNMSSSTLPHVWQDILNNVLQDKQYVISFAFGPGLTMFGAVFRMKK
jgi:predicted naringenin-chalcone synthase